MSPIPKTTKITEADPRRPSLFESPTGSCNVPPACRIRSYKRLHSARFAGTLTRSSTAEDAASPWGLAYLTAGLELNTGIVEQPQ